MVFKCPVLRCIANYDCYDRGAVFSLPENEKQKKQLDLVFKSKGYFIHKESQYLLQTLCRRKVPKEQSFYMNINPYPQSFQ